MPKIMAIVSLILLAGASGASAQSRGSSDRSMGAELSREKAETRIDRLRQDQRDKEERAARGNAKVPAAGSKQQQQQPR